MLPVSSATTSRAKTASTFVSMPPATPRTRSEGFFARIGQDLQNTYNTLCPTNPLTGKRQFFRIPLGLESFIGRCAELADETKPLASFKEGSLEAQTRKVFTALTSSHVLPCYAGRKWDATIRFCDKQVDNAYCAPGCRVTVYTGIQKSIHSFLEDMKCKGQKTIDFKDETGKSISVNVEDVTYEDVMAALLGHELTHGAARHGGVRLVIGTLFSGLLAISSALLTTIAKVFCQEEVIIKKTNPHNTERGQTAQEAKKAEASTTVKEYRFTPMGHLLNGIAYLVGFEFIRNLINSAFTLAHSRKNEYEADKYGMILAQRAGYNAKGALVLMKLLGKGSFDPQNRVARALLNAISTHPLSSDRIRANHATMIELESMRKAAAAAA